MSIPIPASAEIVVDIDSRCFCCFRSPVSNNTSSKTAKTATPDSTVNSVKEKVADVFKAATVFDTSPISSDDVLKMCRERTVSFIE